MPSVLYEKKGKIAYITLNRPESLNAMDMDGWGQLAKAWINVRDDPEVWVAIVTGADTGTERKAFCAGQDLKEIGSLMSGGGGGSAEGFPEGFVLGKGIEVWKPFIAAISGIATGGGLELAMMCDLRIAAEDARLGLREVKQGVMPGGGGTQRLPRLIPFCKALEILMTADFISANEAERLGLVNKVVPTDQLMAEAEALANRICDNGPLAVRAVKEAAYKGTEMPLDKGIEIEQQLVQGLFSTQDAMEGVMAFVAKRKAEYKAA